MAKPSIAIIGLEASGKTVFMTALAKYLADCPQSYYLNPIGNQTVKYIEKNWTILQNGDWPASTPPGEMFKLKWDLCIPTENEHVSKVPLRLIDAAGQDMRQLFSDDVPLEQVPEHFQPLVKYLASASILLIILNIKDYVGEGDVTRRIENQSAIKFALDSLEGSDCSIAFIFTQMDQYRNYISSCGGLEKFCQKELPYIYNAYVNHTSNAVLGVSAVEDTEIREMSDGVLVRVPVPGFSSKGLKEVADWLVEQVRNADKIKKQQELVEREKQAELERQRQAELERQRQAELERQRQAELERQRQAELERQRQAELERHRQAEREWQRQVWREQQKLAEYKRKQKQEKVDEFVGMLIAAIIIWGIVLALEFWG